MATTPGRRVRDGKTKSSHIKYDGTPPYFGDAERFLSGSARADDHEPITQQASVESTVRDADMCDMPGKEFAHVPEEGNKRAARKVKVKGGDIGMNVSGAQIGRAGGRSY